MEWLKSVHFYRKVPTDLTEATLSGGLLSLFSAVAMAYLLFSNFVAFLQVETLTSVRLDESTDKKIQINFNVTLFHLPCRFASVDIADVMGTHLQNVSTNLIKTRIDGNGAAMGKAAPKPRSMSHAFARTANVPTVSPSLDEDGLTQAVTKHKLVLVNYFAPWCPWSRRLQPVQEMHIIFMFGRGSERGVLCTCVTLNCNHCNWKFGRESNRGVLCTCVTLDLCTCVMLDCHCSATSR